MANRRTLIKRNGQVKLINEMLSKGQEIVEGETRNSNQQKEIIALVKNVRNKKISIDELNEEILSTVEEEKMEEEMKNSTELDIKVDTQLEILESYLAMLELDGSKKKVENQYDERSASRSSDRKQNKVNLPKLEIRKFSGDPTLWPEFLDSFNVAINENNDLSDIERFTYLKGYLSGEAARCIEGFTLTTANYNEALNLLKERFGNKKLIISRHMESLLELEKVKSSTLVKELRQLYDKIMVNIRALTAYEITSEQFGPMLSPVILQKLPSDIKLEITRRLKDPDWNIEKLLEVLKTEIEAQETCMSSSMEETKKASYYEQKYYRKDSRDNRITTEALHVGARIIRCAFCNGGHYSDKCSIVTDADVRMELVRKKKLCYKCLGSSHNIRKCRSFAKCYVCKSGSHHTAICSRSKIDNVMSSFRNRQQNQNNVNKDIENSQTVCMAVNQNPVMLQTIRVNAADVKESRKVRANVIFDGGSQKTYISQRLVNVLKLEAVGNQEMKINAFGQSEGKICIVKEYNFCLKGTHTDRFYLKGFAVPVICAPLYNHKVDIGKMKFEHMELQNILPEIEENDGEIDILIGADYYWTLVTEDIIRLEDNLVAIKSKLGYMLSGPLKLPEERQQVISHITNCVHVMKISNVLENEFVVTNDNINVLNEQVEKFWKLDSIGILQNEKSVYDINQEEIEFVNGRYQVQLPFKEAHPILEDNYLHCVKRLNSLKKKLEKTPVLMEKYNEIIANQVKEGIVEVIDAGEEVPDVGNITYLPHRAVINEEKLRKVRIVYDASAKAGDYSLNECLYKGTSVTPLIFDSLLRFRLHDVAMVADIESAYLQISVTPKHREFLRFLWFKNIHEDDYTIEKYRFTRVIFGAAPSQYLLNTVIRKHAEKYSENDPNFEEMVKSGFYVDDLNTSVKTSTEGIDFYKKCKIRFAEAGFNIRKWRSNDPNLKQIFTENEVKFNDIENGKVLGINWDSNSDSLIIRFDEFISNECTENVTKRQILKLMATFYDPVGWIQPIIIKLKILFQEACRLNIDWDDMVTPDLKEKWKNTIEQIKKLKEIMVSRCYCYSEVSNPIIKVFLHGFSDASLSAYGGCVYLKFVKKSGEVNISLVASKSRVAPLKNVQTIPRLELMGNFILARLIVAVVNGFQDKIKIDDVYCHTDSQVSLSWVKAVKKEFKPFVQNRVDEIRRNVKTENWFYCKTNDNPADLLTRAENNGINGLLWWNGPDFLKTANCSTQETILPGKDDIVDFDGELKEVKSSVLIAVENNASLDNLMDVKKYSDVMKLFRVTAYVVRFINNIKQKLNKEDCQDSYLTANEIRNAHNLWVKQNQIKLKNNVEYAQIETQLNCKVDENGIIRSYGRMKYANIPEQSKAPIMLSKEHYLSILIVLYYHSKVMHRGIKQTLNEVRSNYWITRARNFVKKILAPCTVCKKLNCRSYTYPTHSELPELRYDDRYSFASTGCDYLGPLYVLPVYGADCTKLYKAYVVLYTCAATRAVILDVVNSCNTKNFLQSLRRFIARRGCPALMISDNGSSFVANETKEFTSNHLIDWKFNVPYSPWMGGIWERLVSCIKKCLKKTIGMRQINYIELQTLILEIEVILNNRPICADYDDDINEVLSPNHLLFGRRLEMINFQKIDEVKTEYDLNKREKHLEKMINHFWDIWRKEYVISLREGHKCEKLSKREIVNVNDIVLIYDKHQPRHLWKLGRILELIRSKDGEVRAAKLKCGSTGNILSRPVNKLYPIEIRKSSLNVQDKQKMNVNEKQKPNINYGSNIESSNIVEKKIDEIRPKRSAAIIGELKRRNNNSDSFQSLLGGM